MNITKKVLLTVCIVVLALVASIVPCFAFTDDPVTPDVPEFSGSWSSLSTASPLFPVSVTFDASVDSTVTLPPLPQLFDYQPSIYESRSNVFYKDIPDFQYFATGVSDSFVVSDGLKGIEYGHLDYEVTLEASSLSDSIYFDINPTDASASEEGLIHSATFTYPTFYTASIDDIPLFKYHSFDINTSTITERGTIARVVPTSDGYTSYLYSYTLLYDDFTSGTSYYDYDYVPDFYEVNLTVATAPSLDLTSESTIIEQDSYSSIGSLSLIADANRFFGRFGSTTDSFFIFNRECTLTDASVARRFIVTSNPTSASLPPEFAVSDAIVVNVNVDPFTWFTDLITNLFSIELFGSITIGALLITVLCVPAFLLLLRGVAGG